MGFPLLCVLGLSALCEMPVSLTRVEDNITWSSNFYSLLLDGHLMIMPRALKSENLLAVTINRIVLLNFEKTTNEMQKFLKQ
jgi:hypothetical protein